VTGLTFLPAAGQVAMDCSSGKLQSMAIRWSMSAICGLPGKDVALDMMLLGCIVRRFTTCTSHGGDDSGW